MKEGHYIVCGDQSEPVWDNEKGGPKQFVRYAEANTEQAKRADETPGENFYVYEAVSVARASVSRARSTGLVRPGAEQRKAG